MTKALLFFSLLGMLTITHAQNTTAKDWFYGSGISLSDPYFGVAGASTGEVFVVGGGLASNFNFSIAKLDATGANMWRKRYVSRNQGFGSAAVDANNDLLVISAFASVFELDDDTLTTSGVSNNDMFIAKFDGANGDKIWIKAYTQEAPISNKYLANGNVLIQLSVNAGDFFFDGNLVKNHAVASFVFLELDNADGSIVRNFSFPQTDFPAETQYVLNGNTIIYLTLGATGPFNGNTVFIKRKMDVNTMAVLQDDTLTYDSQFNNLLQKLDEVAMHFNSANGDFYIAVGERQDYTVLGTDTVEADHFAILQYDDRLNLKKRVDLNYSASSFQVRDTNLVITMFIPAFSPFQGVFGNDTLVPSIMNETHMFIRSNLDFDNRTYAFIGTSQRGEYAVLKDIQIDAMANVYALGFSQEDIVFPPYTSQAANRSWKHHSALGKLLFGVNNNNVGITEVQKQLKYQIYPNPFSNSFTLSLEGKFAYAMYNQQGQLVKSDEQHEEVQLDMRNVPAGLYMLKITQGAAVIVRKMIKQ